MYTYTAQTKLSFKKIILFFLVIDDDDDNMNQDLNRSVSVVEVRRKNENTYFNKTFPYIECF